MRKSMITIVTILSAVFLAACGAAKSAGGSDTQESVPFAAGGLLAEQDTVVEEEERADRSDFDWHTDQWNNGGGSRTGYPLYVTEYIGDLNYEPEYAYDWRMAEYRTWGHNFYAFETFDIEQGEAQELHYCLSCFEGMTGEIRHQEIILPRVTEYTGEKQLVITYDILDEERYVLFYGIWKDAVMQAYLAIQQSVEGETLSVTDLYPAMCAAGMNLNDYRGFDKIYADAGGFYCLLPGESESEFAAISMEGELICHLDQENPAKDVVYTYGMKGPAGENIFIRAERAGEDLRQLMVFDGEQLEFQILLTQESAWEWDIYGGKALTEDGYLYYLDSYGRLCRWDLYQGVRRIRANYLSLGIGDNEQLVRMITGADGLPLLLDYSQEEAIIFRLGREEVLPQEGIRLVSLVPNSGDMTSYIASGIAAYSQRNRHHPLLMEQSIGEEDYADFRNRKLAELVGGEGADLYYVSRDDMRMLYEKGVAAALTEVIPLSLKNQIFEGVLACGTVNGNLIGIAPEASVSTLLVSDKLWSGNTWNWEEALEVLDSQPEAVQFMASTLYTYASPDYVLELLLQDLSHSPFLDPETGRCDFDNPLFVMLLETAKDCSGTREEEERDRMLQDGRILGAVLDTDGLQAFSREMSMLGEDFHPVGFPTQGESGCYWNVEYYIVVNRETAYMEEITEFIELLFQEKRQMTSRQAVLKNLIASRLIWADWGEKPHWEYNLGGGSYDYLCTKADGTPWLEEYQELLDQCIPREAGYDNIVKIIQEEAASYFDGTKDVADVVDIIQNRVQIYINEQQ